MSWEGYGQALCEKGHQYTVDAHGGEGEACPECQAPQACVRWVDLTNGCEPDCTGEFSLKCQAHDIPLKEIQPAKYDECGACHHKKVLELPRFDVPEEFVKFFHSPRR